MATSSMITTVQTVAETMVTTNTVAKATHSETFDLASDASHLWISEQNPSHRFGGDDFSHPATAAVMGSEAENSVNLAFHAFDDFGSLATRLAAGQHYEVALQT